MTDIQEKTEGNNVIAEIEISDKLNETEIEQLHRATLNFSNNTLETKKICVTAEGVIFTLLSGIYKNSPELLASSIRALGIMIPMLFYLVDVVFYYYQDSLREKMDIATNEIRKRHNLPTKESQHSECRLRRAFINGSQLLYFGLAAIAWIAPLLMA